MVNQDNNLLTLKETAGFLGVKPITLRKWDRENKLKPVRVGARGDRRYYKNDLLIFLEKSQQPKIEWQEYIRRGISYHNLTQAFDASSFEFKKNFGLALNNQIFYFEGNILYAYYDAKTLYEFGHLITDKLISSSKENQNYFVNFDQGAQKLFYFIKKNTEENLLKSSDKELASIYREFNKLFTDWYGYSMIIDATDESLLLDITKKVRSILKQELINKYTEKEFNRAYNILTMPSKLSYIKEEREMLLRLAKDIKDKKIEQESEEFINRCQEIISKFWWTNLGWARDKAKTGQDISNNLAEIKKSAVNITKELQLINDYSKETQVHKSQLEKEYGFSKDKQLIKYLQLFDKLVGYHDYRKEVQMKVNFWNYLFFDEVAKRKRVPVSLLDWCDANEVVDLILLDKFNETDLNQRSDRFLQLRIGNKIRSYSGKEAMRKYKEVMSFQSEETRDLQGISVSGGKIISTAHVALTIDTALKIQSGQVLVTSMTTPEFLPAMRKAAAIITDEGDYTCHAAIVARVLGIPCIVGTNYATKLIQTGNLLEVSANHGVVRILRK